jgi:hypothetical protein
MKIKYFWASAIQRMLMKMIPLTGWVRQEVKGGFQTQQKVLKVTQLIMAWILRAEAQPILL